MEKKQALILVTNDDGVHAKGIGALIRIVQDFGKVIVVAPDKGQSGMSHAITVAHPLRIHSIKKEANLEIYSCNGTPADCIKLAMNEIIKGKPDLIVSGINHGSNAATSVIYSGTMAGAVEGCLNGVSSIAFSFTNFDPNADFSVVEKIAPAIVEKVIQNPLPRWTCLNVNIPDIAFEQIKGIQVCRETMGVWQEEFERRTDPMGRNYFWLTGRFDNLEPTSTDTDEWALHNHYVAIAPIKLDFTDYENLEMMKNWFE